MQSGWKFLRMGGAAVVIGILAFSPARAAAPSRESSPPSKSPIVYRYVVSQKRSRISLTFRGPLAVPYDAHFTVLKGELFLGSGGSFKGANGHIAIKSASLKSKKAEQQKMLLRNVLEASAYPDIELRVSSIKATGVPASREQRKREKDWRLTARGVLKLHGVEREIPLSFSMADTGTDLYIRGTGRLELSDFDMSRPTLLLLMPGSGDVVVRVRLVASPGVR